MRFSLVVLIFAVLASDFVKADTQSCVNGLTKCTEVSCAAALLTWASCVGTNACPNKIANLDEYKTCMGTTCKSSNADAQAYIDKVVACVDGSIFRFALVALVGLFFAF